ncbi:MAG TPA: hypothetical protein VFG76_03135, partial [Candidatus Polarisedimenticolia bacterium]|nr:hypothetical protein [Candidatus Polarisedimenticolia bacterium]
MHSDAKSFFKRLFSAVALLACASLSSSVTLATCGSANCFLVTGTQEGVGLKGKLTVDLSYRYIVQSKGLEGTNGVSDVLAPKIEFENREIEKDHHREIRTQNTLVQLDLAWGVTDRLTVAGSFPLINDRDHEHFDEAGTAQEFFTREDGSSGFGDVRLGARYGFLVRTKNLLVGGVTVKLPTGQYRLNDSEGEINEPTIQPGTGSTDAIAGLYYAHQWIPLRFEYFVSGSQKVNGENDLDYRFGAESLLNAGISYTASGRITWTVQVNARKTAHDLYLRE